MEYPKKIEKELNQIGSNIKRKLDDQYAQWQNGIEYRYLLTSYATRAKKLGLDLSELAYALQDLGYVKIFSTPQGKRYCYSADVPMTQEEIVTQLMEIDYAAKKGRPASV